MVGRLSCTYTGIAVILKDEFPVHEILVSAFMGSMASV